MKTIGSLFSGYGGLDLGTQLALGPMRTAWVSYIEKGPQAILAHRFADSPNLGDVTAVDWANVEPVDVLAGGSPCQDLSTAGQRAGMKPGTRSGLWESMAHAISVLHPSLVIWENVKGALSADGYSLCDMEPGAGCVGNGAGRSSQRALGRVLGDLANLGYDAAWDSVRASTVGAPHQRERVFVVAYPHHAGWGEPGRIVPGVQEHGPTVAGERLLPTPTTIDSHPDAPSNGRRNTPPLRHYPAHLSPTAFAAYTPAITRWETVLGRPAPHPAKDGQLSPAFVEWMMGLPDGWVTDAPLSRTQQLRALGNGVVPQQAAYAISTILSWRAEEWSA